MRSTVLVLASPTQAATLASKIPRVVSRRRKPWTRKSKEQAWLAHKHTPVQRKTRMRFRMLRVQTVQPCLALSAQEA